MKILCRHISAAVVVNLNRQKLADHVLCDGTFYRDLGANQFNRMTEPEPTAFQRIAKLDFSGMPARARTTEVFV